jgi:translation elongation factor EF-Ts
MYDEDDDENDDEDDEDDCHEFDDMMRLAKNTGCRVMLCMMAMGKNDHDYDIALDWLIDNGHYTPENS